MINTRYRRYVQSFLLVLPMTALVTAINTLVAQGLGAVFTMETLKKWAVSLAIAFPVLLVMAPLSVKLTNRLVKND